MNGGIDPKLERPGFETKYLGFHVCCVYCEGVWGFLLLLLTRGGGLKRQRPKEERGRVLWKEGNERFKRILPSRKLRMLIYCGREGMKYDGRV